MHSAPIDLQFLYLLEALFEERNVTAAADRLGMSQTALSHALGRMRIRFADALFVKTSSGMQPTPMAERLALSAKRALQVVRQEIQPALPFDPLTSDRSFTICLSDMGGAVLLHRIVKAFAQQAPNVHIRPLQIPAQQIGTELEAGHIDLAIGYYPDIQGPLYQQSLFRRNHVCIVRADHPYIHDTLSLDQFAETPHVLSTLIAAANKFVDRALHRQGRRRQIALEVPYLLAVPNIIAETDYLAMVPAELAELSKRVAPVRILAMPIKPPLLVIRQYWHRRFHADPDGKWLRGIIAETLGE